MSIWACRQRHELAVIHPSGKQEAAQSAWCEVCAQPPAWLLPRREPVLEALYVQRAASEDSNLNLLRIGSVILVQEMPEIEGARNGRLPFQAPKPSALLRPAPVQRPVLAGNWIGVASGWTRGVHLSQLGVSR